MNAPANAAMGIMGGTFDPIHFGHLRLAQEAAESLGLGQVRWIPAGQPWHRNPPMAAAVHRLQMVRLAIARNPLFELDDAEVRQASPGYTVDTLERLRRELGPRRALVLLLGADAFLGLTTWRRWRELFGLAHIAVAQRPGHTLQPEAMPAELGEEWRRRAATREQLLGAPGGNIFACGTTGLEISSSAIRTQLAQGRSPHYLLPCAVLDYIGAQRLYTQENEAA